MPVTVCSNEATISINKADAVNNIYNDTIKFDTTGVADYISAAKITTIDLGSPSASLQVSKTLILHNAITNNDCISDPSLSIVVTQSSTLILDGTVTVNYDNETNMPLSSIKLITLQPGGTIVSMSDSIIFEHMMTGGQSFTNNNDFTTKLIFNDQLSTFELQPLGDTLDLS